MFLCVNAALLYPSKVTFNTKLNKEKLKNIFKTTTQFRETLERCKSCLGNQTGLQKNEMKHEQCDQLLPEQKDNSTTIHSDFQLSENYMNTNVSMKTTVLRTTPTTFPAANTNINCLQTALSHTSICEGEFNEENCQEPVLDEKPCRSSHLKLDCCNFY